MAKQESQSRLNLPTQARAKATHAIAAAELGHDANGLMATVVPKTRQIYKAGEVKASLRMVQAKTGYSLKDCLAEALRDLFRKHNVPVSVEQGEGR